MMTLMLSMNQNPQALELVNKIITGEIDFHSFTLFLTMKHLKIEYPNHP